MKECPLCKREMRDQLLFCPFDGQTLVSANPADRFIGLILEGKYRIEEKVGEGGMGQVYRGTHILMDHTVAIKILHPHLASDEVAVERFRREARAAASIRHPNAVAVTDFGVNKDTGVSYLVMEFLEGIELREAIKERRRLDFEEAFIITQQICSALQAAHAKGIIHRDLKPDNIWLLKSEDGFPRVKVLDFGIAKLMAGSVGNLTQQGMIVGTPYYMSPEQCVGDELDARSDIYSLGIIIYEILTGRVPFRASTPMGVALKHANEPPMPPRELRLDLPYAIENVMLRALRKHPEERQGSAMELAQEFESALYKAGVELRFLNRTPPDAHQLNAYRDLSIPPVDWSISPDRSNPPVDRSTPPDRSLRPEGSASGASPAVDSPASGQAPEPVPRRADPVVFQQLSRAPLHVFDWLPESQRARKISIIALAAVLIVAAVVSVLVWGRRGAISAGPPKPDNTASAAERTAAVTPPGMVYVPGGKFVMGNDQSRDRADKPEHEVSVVPFFMDQYEVTNEEYQRFLAANPGYPAPENWVNRQFPEGQARYAVTMVTWGEAKDCAEWAGKRLPSEEEWEYAARGTDKRIYPWGNEFDPTYAATKESNTNGSVPVDRFSGDKSPFGVFDMAGNVAEWTSSAYKPYRGSEAKPVPNSFVVRGGFYDRPHSLVTSRLLAKPDEKRSFLGFRCAKDASR